MEALEHEYAQLRQIWQEFNELFAKDGTRINLMNDVAPAFFSMMQNLMIEAMVIRMSRITDGKGFGNTENLTMQRIPAALPEEKHADKQELEALIDTAKKHANKVRVWRNKRVAHLDLNHFMSEDRTKFTIGFTEVRESIEAIHAALNRTSIIVWDRELGSEVLLSGGTAASLIAALQRVPDPG